MSATHRRAKVCLATSLFFAFATAFNASAHPPQESATAALPSVAQSAVIFRQLEPELQRFVDQQERLPGQEARVRVRINPDPATDTVWVDLDSGYLPKGQAEFSEALGEKVGEIRAELDNYLSEVVEFKFVRARIGGKTLDEIFPPEYLKKRKGKQGAHALAAPVPGLVVLNPGHGKYLHHKTNTWEYQRPDPYAGTTDIYEDGVTPGYSSMLASMLSLRSGDLVTDIRHTRAMNEAGIDPESNLTWSVLAARYQMKRLYPNLGATIWNRYPNGTGDPIRKHLREYDEDLMARPLYANYVNAEALISLHTDGGVPTARGATVLTKLNDPSSLQLSSNIICYMKEQIHTLEAYATYSVRPTPQEGNEKAEVREAAMPTALIELGFHTNMDDSAALRDSAFRIVAMRGVEKGYRTFKRGETDCRPLTITSAPPVTGPHFSQIPYSVEFTGTPTYPLYLRTKVVTCPPDYLCSQKSEQYVSAGPTPGKLDGTAKCTVVRPVPGSVIVVDRYLEDGDGVKSPVVRSQITCT